MKRTILVDGDLVAFQLSAAVQRTYELPEVDTPVVIADAEQTVEGMVSLVDGWARKLRADRVIVCLSDDFANYRKRILPTYKESRKGSNRPVLLYDMKDALAGRFEVERWPTLEADDVMGILATEPVENERRCMVSIDKDMQCIPGWLYNPGKDTKPRLIDPVSADRWFLTQAITGDPVDGYKGCPGVGPKSKFVARVKEATDTAEMWAAVVEAYESKGLSREDALTQARCAYILRHGDWDGHHPVLWNPPV